ncbi:hypothetical protein SRHO_G00022990 [Serrasalmus rhombeus]
MITLISALCLFNTVKTGISGLQVQTVRRGNNVVIKCDENIVKDKETHDLAWYRQSLGNVPEVILRQFGDGEKLRFTSDFKDGRFTVDEEAFDLGIRGIKQEDAGTYFCGKVKANSIEFGSGTRLIFQAEKIHHPPTEMVIKTGDSILFGNQTKVTVQENNSWSFIIPITLNVIFVIVIVALIGVLHKSQLNGASNSHSRHTDQADHTGLFNAVLSFAKRVKESQDLYSQVEYS